MTSTPEPNLGLRTPPASGDSRGRPTRLRVEHLDRPLGIDVPRPRLSWLLPAGATRQLARRIRAGAWDSGRVEASGSLLIPYQGPQPAARERIPWQVKVWTDLGESEWSEPSWWETGLTARDDWQAVWIEPAEAQPQAPAGRRPAHLLRHDFTARGPVARARVYATAHGIYEVFVNGDGSATTSSTPGFTAYRKRLQVFSTTSTELLPTGRQPRGEVLLSDGWFRGRHGFERRGRRLRQRDRAAARSSIVDTDGPTARDRHGPNWRSCPSHVTRADLMDGQPVDLRLLDPARTAPWHPVGRPRPDGSTTTATRLVEALAGSPCAGSRAARPRQLTVTAGRAPAVHRLRSEHQRLGASDRPRPRRDPADPHPRRGARRRRRSSTTEHLRAFDLRDRRAAAAGQVDEVVSSRARRATCSSRGTPPTGSATSRSTGIPDELARGRRRPASSCTPTCGALGGSPAATSGMNRLHEAGRVELPRQRLRRSRPTARSASARASPATGRSSSPPPPCSTTSRGSRAKWLRDLAADQWSDGRVPTVVPDPAGDSRPAGLFEDLVDRLGRLGRRRRDRAVGDLARLRRPRRCCASSTRR